MTAGGARGVSGGDVCRDDEGWLRLVVRLVDERVEHSALTYGESAGLSLCPPPPARARPPGLRP